MQSNLSTMGLLRLKTSYLSVEEKGIISKSGRCCRGRLVVRHHSMACNYKLEGVDLTDAKKTSQIHKR